MRYFFCLFIAFSLSVCSTLAQEPDKSCYYGISFEMSANPSWGYGELVITRVDSASPAERAGIKVGDIIMEINGKATYLRNSELIGEMLYNTESSSVEFTIRNVDYYFKKYRLHRNCVSLNSVSEQYLSQIYSLYSTENTNQRIFTLPIQIEANRKVDYSDYHTFNFYTTGVPTEQELQIFAQLETILIQKGLKKDTKDPEMIIQVYSKYEANQKRIETEPTEKAKTTFRYNEHTQQMVELPIFDIDDKSKIKDARRIAQFGITFYDSKYINTRQVTKIWECFIKDYLSTDYAYDEYLALHIPLMMKNYPYTESKTNIRYLVSHNKYYYTGIHFGINDLATIRDVDRYSPAYEAGIRSGYLISKVNDKTFRSTSQELSVAYNAFVKETMPYRDISTKFTDAKGYTESMFWNKEYYLEIQQSFGKESNLTLFSYLYGFEPYINLPNNKVVVEAWDGMQERRFNLIPVLRNSIELEILK